MSASSKKKLRKEQNAAALTEKQLNEQKEAKTLKRYTWTFVITMILVVAIALGVVVRLPIVGAIDRGSHAVTIGTHKLSATDLSYYFVDAINDYYNEAYNMYGTYASLLLGFDTNKPLNEQKYTLGDEYATWADYFMETGIENATGIYALYDEAIKNGHEMTEEEKNALESNIESVKQIAELYGYSNANAYLRASYGDGANLKTYTEYYTVNSLASSYYKAHSDSIEYTDEQYRAHEKGQYNSYSSYTFATYSVVVKDYLTGGTKDDKGNTTYSDEEKKAALEAAKADADKLAAGSYKDREAFDKAVQALAINKDKKNIASLKYDNTLYGNITSPDVKRWVGNVNRKPGELTSIVVTKENKEDKDNPTLETISYTVVFFEECNENKVNLVDVRHILVKFQGGKYDSSTQTTLYSETEKNAAKEKAEAILKEWKDGEATEESFAALATSKTEDGGSKTTGGLYEDIYPGQMVTNFNDWCFDSKRVVGETGLVATEYGYHVMYFVGKGDITYRDLMIKNELLTEDMDKWHTELTEKVTVEKVDLSRMDWGYKFG